MKINCLFTAAFASMAAVGGFTQMSAADTPDNTDDSVIFESGAIEFVRTSPVEYQILKEARPVEPDAVPVPKFAIKTKNNAFMMAIGGKINPIVGYDIGNDLYDSDGGGINFTTGAIHVPPQPGHKGDFFINPIKSFLDFTIVGFGGTKDQITGYIKLSTNGAKPGINLHRAYISYRGFTFGEVSTLMCDGLACQPPTIDPQGPNGDVNSTAYQISYKSPSFNGFRFAVGLEMPSFSSAAGYYHGKDYNHSNYIGVQVTADANQMVPDIPAWVEYQASEQNRIRFTGLLRNFAYRDLVNAKTRHMAGWGAMVSGNFSFYKPLTFNFQAVYGKGIGNYIQDLADRELSFVPDEEEIGKMEASPMMGLVFGASFNATKRLQFNAVGSYARIWDVADYAVLGDTPGVAGENNFKQSVYVAANCFYTISNYFKWGIEYLYGRHYTYSMGAANDSRIQTQFIFTF